MRIKYYCAEEAHHVSNVERQNTLLLQHRDLQLCIKHQCTIYTYNRSMYFHLRSAFLENVHHFLLVELSGHFQCSHSLHVLHPHVHAMVQQHVHNVYVARVGREHEGRPAVFLLEVGVDIRHGEQSAHHLGLARMRGDNQCRSAQQGLGVHIGSVLEQIEDGEEVSQSDGALEGDVGNATRQFRILAELCVAVGHVTFLTLNQRVCIAIQKLLHDNGVALEDMHRNGTVSLQLR